MVKRLLGAVRVLLGPELDADNVKGQTAALVPHEGLMLALGNVNRLIGSKRCLGFRTKRGHIVKANLPPLALVHDFAASLLCHFPERRLRRLRHLLPGPRSSLCRGSLFWCCWLGL